MPHDFNKPSHVQTPEERQKKKRVPLYILALVGIFLIALLFYNTLKILIHLSIQC